MSEHSRNLAQHEFYTRALDEIDAVAPLDEVGTRVVLRHLTEAYLLGARHKLEEADDG